MRPDIAPGGVFPDQLVAFYPQIAAGYTQIVTLSNDNVLLSNDFRAAVGARWVLLPRPD
jgi:hypothetical protein